ncbi:MAG: dihydroorotate dehydrogenase electron transfer subunit [Desulfotomaculum sp.]|nr:dihydroorotate dehydrogenase electron transfer subunit [Desulfotomaculum sp.]
MLLNGKLITHKNIAGDYYLMEFKSHELAEAAGPGQFVHVKCGSTNDPLLRRPISIHKADKDKGIIALLYRVAGKGTRLLSLMEPGDLLDVMGPLGNGFQLPKPSEKVAVVAGGIGVAPLFFLVQLLVNAGNDVQMYIGARTSQDLLAVKDIKKLGVDVKLATDDGSAGYHGLVTDLLPEKLQKVDRIYTCGPFPMMKSVAYLANKYNVPAQVSLEEKMGCGVGACLACSCKIKINGESVYKRVCTEGPVFNAGEVDWEC